MFAVVIGSLFMGAHCSLHPPLVEFQPVPSGQEVAVASSVPGEGARAPVLLYSSNIDEPSARCSSAVTTAAVV